MFQSDFNWDVDKSALHLDKSLFHKKKKHKVSTVVPKSSQANNWLPDSDEETFSKKGKKKLKTKRQKQAKRAKGSKEEIEDTESIHNDARSDLAVNEKLPAVKKEKKRKKNKTDAPQTKKDANSPKKSHKKSATDSSKENGEQQVKLNKRKRQRSLSEADSEGPKSKKKRKVEEGGNDKDLSIPELPKSAEGTKKKRKRKKKNDPRKNKYRHLALNPRPLPEKHQESGGKTEKKPFVPEPNSSQNSKANVSNKQKNKRPLNVNSTEKHLGDISNFSESADKNESPKKKKKKKREKELSDGEESVQTNSKNVPGKTDQFQVHDNLNSEKIGGENIKKVKSKKNKVKKSENTNQSPSSLKPGEIDDGKNEKSKKEKNDKPASNQDLYNKFAEHLNKADDSRTKAASLWGEGRGIAEKAKEKLNSARFRHLNEQLYTCTGQEALQLFRDDREAFKVYHVGFESQAGKWPVNPLDIITKQIKDKPRNLVIADFGCGDAKLASHLPHKVHSFDFVALNKRVTACDMAKTPLPKESVDIAVFCLSLMGTNINDYLHEANRVLKIGGLLKVAEVTSRFRGLSSFTEAVAAHGFVMVNKRDVSEMFYLFDFKKTKTTKNAPSKEIRLNPCVYKRR